MQTLELIKAKGALEIFATLSKYPKRRFSMNELAKLSSVPFATAWNIIRNFDQSGIVDTEKIGRSIAVSLRNSDITKALKSLLSMPSSPHQFILQKLKTQLKNVGVKHAYVFGSVAEGKETLESDLDVAVIASASLENIAASIYSSDKIRVVFIRFNKEKELEKFLEGKISRRLL